MKTLTSSTLFVVTLLASCQPASHSSTKSDAENNTPVKLEVVKETQTVLRPAGDEVIVSIGEIRQAPAAIFELSTEPKTIGLIQLKAAQNAEEAKAQCTALGESWQLMRNTDLIALLASGNMGGIYNSMTAVPGIDSLLAFPAWVENSTDKTAQMMVFIEGHGDDMLSVEQLSKELGSEAAQTFMSNAQQNTTVYCISGEIK